LNYKLEAPKLAPQIVHYNIRNEFFWWTAK
jgi:hypothetical protein